jgi:nitrogen fixation/metabolism regulation signal transduction histidine kinase
MPVFSFFSFWKPRIARTVLLTAIVSMVLTSLVLLFLLIQATANYREYEHDFSLLFGLNATVATLLLILIAVLVTGIGRRFQQGRFGSHLLLKLALVFVMMGIGPSLLVYGISDEFVSRSIEDGFDSQVEHALTTGLNLGRHMLVGFQTKLREQAQQAVETLESRSWKELSNPHTLSDLRERWGLTQILLWDDKGHVQASSGTIDAKQAFFPLPPTPHQLRQIRRQSIWISTEELEDMRADTLQTRSPVYLRAWAVLKKPTSWQSDLNTPLNTRLNTTELQTPVYYLELAQALPIDLLGQAWALQEAHRQYQEHALATEGLKKMYRATLTLSLCLGVLGAVLCAVVLGRQLVKPILLLAQGMRRVADGDLSHPPTLETHDELGGLTRSFAQMTGRLAQAHATAQSSLSALTTARQNLQTVLDNQSSGVIVFDAQGHVVLYNPSASRVLQTSISPGQVIYDWPVLAPWVEEIQARFIRLEEFIAHRTSQGDLTDSQTPSRPSGATALELPHPHWEATLVLDGESPSTHALQHLLVRGACMPGHLHLLVLDDISQIISAQRMQAWAEVAKRLAHEIKNPLTPIRLSAERLKAKLSSVLSHEADQALLARSVQIIVDQVDAMQRLVQAFREYGRLPSAVRQPININDLLRDVTYLYESSPERPMHSMDASQDKVQEEAQEKAEIQVLIDPDCPAVLADCDQLRQLIHNLLQNAQDALTTQLQTHRMPSAKARIEIYTQWQAEKRQVILTITDNGPGFAPTVLQRAFEPYVTTKAKGTGLGLAMVKKIAEEHQALLELGNGPAPGIPLSQAYQGAWVRVIFSALN